MTVRPPRILAAAVALVMLVGLNGCDSTGSSRPPATSKETFCGLLLSFRATNDALDDELASGDPARAEAAIKRMVSQARVLQDRSPADIRPDVDVVTDFVTKLEDLMARNGYSISAIEANEAAATEFGEINNDAVASSLAQLRAFGDQDCATSNSG